MTPELSLALTLLSDALTLAAVVYLVREKPKPPEPPQDWRGYSTRTMDD